MNNKIKDIVVTIIASLFILTFSVLCIIHEPVAESTSERRPLAQFPEDITFENIINKKVINDFEDYSVDQFPFREFFRCIKANFQLNVLNLKENNGYALENGYITKVESEFNRSFVKSSLEILSKIHDKFIKDSGSNVYITLIPDKNYYFSEYGYLSPSYDWLVECYKEALPNATYIDLFDSLSLDDYYMTDTHWRQDRLENVVDTLSKSMSNVIKGEGYRYETLEPFEGVYYKQSALYPKKTDSLVYMLNDTIENSTVFDYETGKTYGIYAVDKFNSGKDGYDVYLHGTRALIRIDNSRTDSDKELIIFRDSFGSSLAPLLIEGYKSVYLVDIRYVEPSMLGGFLDFKDKDILFAYSSLIFNSNTFRTMK